MDLDQLRHLIELMNANDLVELEVAEGDTKVRLRKGGDHGANGVLAAPAAAPTAAMQAPTAAPAPQSAASAPAAVPARAPDLVEIRSPLVGTFYRAARPESDAFVSVGDKVNEEKVVCIVEAMKVMNEIKAEVTGIVTEILVRNGDPVEFGQPMFLVRKPA